MAQITYTNKQFVNQNANVPAINKVQDSDMNEIKSVVNGLLTSSTSSDSTLGYTAPFLNGITIEDSGAGYIRFGDGTQICYYSKDVTTTVNAAFGNVKRSAAFLMDNFAKAFSSTPIISLSVTGTQGAWLMPANQGVSTTNPGNQYLLRGDTLSTATTFTVNCIAVGKWK